VQNISAVEPERVLGGSVKHCDKKAGISLGFRETGEKSFEDFGNDIPIEAIGAVRSVDYPWFFYRLWYRASL